MSQPQRKVLVTGCSDGGMGAELAQEFHRAGLKVYATARSLSKMQGLSAQGIETLQLDITSESSIAECVKKIPSLDILINNAGANYTMPISDISISEAKGLFETNFWGAIATTQAFLPLLLESPKAIIANHTSVGAGLPIPFQMTYNASKAALAMFTEALRLELQPFDIAVVELRTGGVKTNIAQNTLARQPQLPVGSIYTPAKDVVEKALRLEYFTDMGTPADQWAKGVVKDLLRSNPPRSVWRGESASVAWFASILPTWMFDGMVGKMTGLDKATAILKKGSRTKGVDGR